MSFPRVLPLGDTAVAVELGDTLSAGTNAAVRALDAALARAPFEGLRETVPTHRSLLVLYEPSATRFADVARTLLALAGAPATPPPPGRSHEVPVVYGGEDGPDLAALARERSLPEQELVRLHSSVEYTAFMLGFTPGFAYLGLLPEALESLRRRTPRVRVPAGSVAIAGRQAGIYPVASPGGWQLVGRTSLRLFDPLRERPALFAPGDRVRFRAVPELPPAEPSLASSFVPGPPVAEVLEAGLLTSVQDLGRVGFRRLGVSGAGALDPLAHAAANRALGNPETAAALECTIAGPSLRFLAPVRIAVAGADLGAVLERDDLGTWPVPLGAAVLARPGNVLRFVRRVTGCRATIAFRGGLAAPVVLGSRSTDLQSAFGGPFGRALATGDRLGLEGVASAAEVESRSTPRPDRVTVGVVLGPQADHFSRETIARFLAEPWRIGATSDRVGCRLEGDPLRHSGPAEILSDGMLPGAIQVPPDGRPIVMLNDGPTTGGYPKIATVIAPDLPGLAQLVPGEGQVRFEAVEDHALWGSR